MVTNHYVWDDDDNESLCGLDVMETEWIPDHVMVDCNQCYIVDQMLTDIEINLNIYDDFSFALYKSFMNVGEINV